MEGNLELVQNQYIYKVSIIFPNQEYANIAKNSIEVDLPFQETKTKKTSIKREMNAQQQPDSSFGILETVFTCNEDEIINLRTCVSSFIQTLALVCETLKEFGQ